MIKITLKTGERLSSDKIKEYVNTHNTSMFIDNDKYVKGENTGILSKKKIDDNAPDNRVPVSYGKKIITTVVGYMYKPGLISYKCDDKIFKKELDNVFKINKESIKTARVGKKASTHGIGYELHYVDKQDNVTIPKFAIIDQKEIIPIYDYSIEPQLVCAIRYYEVDSETKEKHIDVYYKDIVRYYALCDGDIAERFDEKENVYGQVPLVVYQNNDESQGDFECVKRLIDAYDVLISDSMNELDRFATAYLILRGLSMEKKDADEIKVKRIIETFENGGVNFLTKDIPTGFITFMTDLLRSEIHKQSHVPDFLNSKTGDIASGVAIDKLLYDFEFIAATKEAFFKDGLQKRIELISKIIYAKKGMIGKAIGKVLGENEGSDIEIIMQRNKPQNLKELSETMINYAGHGIADETLISNFAPFVQDPKKEIEKFKNEQEGSIDLDTINIEEGEKLSTEDRIIKIVHEELEKRQQEVA